MHDATRLGTLDYYATLSVSSTSEDVVIRAAYLALMRRYHPDTNSSPEAAERVRGVTTAYEVLSNADKRADYDRRRDFYRPASPAFERPQRPPVGPIFFGATVVLLSLAVLALWMKPSGTTNQTGPTVAAANASNAPLAEEWCMRPNSAEEISKELVRQAGKKLRSVDRRALLAIAPQMVVRLSPALASRAAGKSGKVNCKGTVEMILPVGMTLPDGRRTFGGEIDYSVRSQGGGPKVFFAAADEFVVKLASLRQPQTSLPEPKVELADALPQIIEPTLPATRLQPVVAAAPQVRARTAPVGGGATRPAAAPPAPRLSVSKMVALAAPKSKSVADTGCRKYGTRWTELLCENKRLAALDQHLGVFEAQSRAQANGDKRDELLRSWGQFSASRIQCTTEACLRQLYLGRMKVVAGVMSQNQKKSSN